MVLKTCLDKKLIYIWFLSKKNREKMNCSECHTVHRLYECPCAENILRDMKTIYLILLATDIDSIADFSPEIDISSIMKSKYSQTLLLRFSKTQLKIVGVTWLCSTAYRWRKDRLIDEIYNWMANYYSNEETLDEKNTFITNFHKDKL